MPPAKITGNCMVWYAGVEEGVQKLCQSLCLVTAQERLWYLASNHPALKNETRGVLFLAPSYPAVKKVSLHHLLAVSDDTTRKTLISCTILPSKMKSLYPWKKPLHQILSLCSTTLQSDLGKHLFCHTESFFFIFIRIFNFLFALLIFAFTPSWNKQ